MIWMARLQFPERSGIFLFSTTYRSASYTAGTRASCSRRKGAGAWKLPHLM